MGYIVRMPKLGLEMDRGTLVTWAVAVDEAVDEGDLVAEVESEKTVGEIEAREAGTLRRRFVEEGDDVPPGAPVGIVAGAGEDIAELEREAASSDDVTVDDGAADGSVDSDAEAAAMDETTASSDGNAASRSSTDEVRASPRARKRADELGVELAVVEPTGPQESVTEADVEAAAGASTPATNGETSGASADTSGASVKASPRARNRAEELGVDLTSVEPTGPQGSVTEGDVEAAAESTPAATAADAGGGSAPTIREERTFGGMRRTIAQRLGQSYRDAVHVTEHRTVDAEALLAATDAAKASVDADISVNDVLLVALSATLAEHPAFNATFEDDTHRLYEEHNVCVAVDVDAGLVAPVVRDVGSLSLDTLSERRREVTRRTLDGDYTSDDLSGGTFTVTNLGVLGVESFDPVINPPQVAILGVDAFDERPVSTDDGITFRTHLPLDLSFDHRVVDGADAARFLSTLVDHLEDPWPLLPDAVRAERNDERTTESASNQLPERHVRAHLRDDLSGVVSAGSTEWSFDVEEEFGGGGAPTPVDLFLGSLSACLSASIGIQADIREVDLTAVDVETDATPDEGSVASITVRVFIDGDADDETLDRIVRMGERTCHVEELLREDLPIELSWSRTD